MDELRQIAGVLGVLALLFAGLWALRRGRGWPIAILPQGRARAMASVDRLALSPQHALHLVRLGDRELVVATHPHGCAVLSERPSSEVNA